MPQKNDNFHSEDVREIMGRAPSWVVRWGVTVVFLIFVGILVGCYYIRYPEVVAAPVQIMAQGELTDSIGRSDVVPDTVCVMTENATREESDDPGFYGAKIHVVGYMLIPSSDLSKVKRGQRVNVRLKGWPYMEYGMLQGVVDAISVDLEQTVDGSLTYRVRFRFPDGLVTSYGEELPLIRRMDGAGEILTEDQRLIQRLMQPIISLFSRR